MPANRRLRFEDPAKSKIPSQLLDMSSDGNGVSSKEGKMFLNNSSPMNIDILESRNPSNLVFQPLEHGTKQTFSLFEAVVVTESANPLGNPVQVSVTHCKDI
jgi:hypothetical protein